MNAALAWDYSALARHYRHRAPYADDALRQLFALIGAPPRTHAVDIGAGTGRFTESLIARGFDVTAIEPNPDMRSLGAAAHPAARWLDARGEATGLADACCRIVAFGSSFNVLTASAALAESARLLTPGGWLVCLWNHRDLDDPLQAALQTDIEREVPGYAHGTRRDDPSATIAADGRFETPLKIVGRTWHAIDTRDFVEGFRAHATLVRQAGACMPQVLDALSRRLAGSVRIAVPFLTRVFAARRVE
jgi:SAM-dependent methyltransferase